MKLGILGGTFDPVHYGHIQMGLDAADELALDKTLFVPAGNSYFKENVTDYEKRCEMLEIVLRDYEKLELSRLDASDGRPSYTYELLEKIQTQYPGAKMYFICGMDAYSSMHSWKYPDRIIEKATLVVYSRNSAEEAAAHSRMKKLYPEIKAVYMKKQIDDISSTDIRRKVSTGESLEGLVPGGVERYIKEQRLYQSEMVKDFF